MIASAPRKMLIEEQVLEIVPVSRSTLWRMERTGKFPRSTYISSNRRVWYEDEICNWQNAVSEIKPHRRGGKTPPVVPAP
jgi:predicted DNA-binding transcriptional regulator AlpA